MLVHEGLQRACPFADNEKEKCVGLAEGGVVTDESLVERLRLEPLAGLRALRKALREEERQVSYWRRLVQGRLDLEQAALSKRRRNLHARIDACTTELVDRYRRDPEELRRLGPSPR